MRFCYFLSNVDRRPSTDIPFYNWQTKTSSPAKMGE